MVRRTQPTRGTRQYKPRSVKDILASRTQPKLKVTKVEKAIIQRDLDKIVGKHVGRELDEYVSKVLKPRADLFRRLKSLHPEGMDLPALQALEATAVSARPPLGYRPRDLAELEPRESTIIQGDIIGTSSLKPPYESALGTPSPERVGRRSEPPYFHTASSLAMPEPGHLSVGASIGRDAAHVAYPGVPDSQYGGYSNYANADLIQVWPLSLPAPRSSHTIVNVTVDVDARSKSGQTDPYGAAWNFAEGALADGTYSVLGSIWLILYGDSVEIESVTPQRFLEIQAPIVGAGFDSEFSVSGSLTMKPNADSFIIGVRAQLWAHRDTSLDAGYAYADFRDPVTSNKSVFSSQLGGGPIRILKMTATLYRTYLPALGRTLARTPALGRTLARTARRK